MGVGAIVFLGALFGFVQLQIFKWNSFSEALLEIAATVARMPAICLETLCV